MDAIEFLHTCYRSTGHSLAAVPDKALQAETDPRVPNPGLHRSPEPFLGHWNVAVPA